jgi:hypothetical protein
MKKIVVIASIFLVPLLAACASEGTPSPKVGMAQRTNTAVQIVNPEAGKTGGVAAYDGEHAGLAQDKYAKGTVEKPESPNSKIAGGGGS